MKNILTIVIGLLNFVLYSQETIDFPSKDELLVTADVYEAKDSNQFIILFHQAGWSRGEYKEIAPKLTELGYNCIAIDQRSGGEVNGVKNKTNALATKKGKSTEFVDAFQDIQAAVTYVKTIYKPEKVIIWGSSYSSSLVLKYAGDHPDEVQAVLSFSPGEYFKQKGFIAKSAATIKIPVFITSAQNEKKNWLGIYDAIPTSTKKSFLPATKGNHGSRALWAKFSDNGAYWDEVQKFLKTI
ncbi:alpha/beta hydrolase [Aquimarina sp. RZ0]|uniref:alpha/beta hydrolase n=1 Tax=Aquimarina sp. RZ0 TaxID=2607730 RepID=UPI0011F09E45|nr:alpha/beta fold hydrolase [Aquimarina sp. RZ0]KAA1245582.1 lysophospholipase [Aquimarina sp. RZ0]